MTEIQTFKQILQEYASRPHTCKVNIGRQQNETSEIRTKLGASPNDFFGEMRN